MSLALTVMVTLAVIVSDSDTVSDGDSDTDWHEQHKLHIAGHKHALSTFCTCRPQVYRGSPAPLHPMPLKTLIHLMLSCSSFFERQTDIILLDTVELRQSLLSDKILHEMCLFLVITVHKGQHHTDSVKDYWSNHNSFTWFFMETLSNVTHSSTYLDFCFLWQQEWPSHDGSKLQPTMYNENNIVSIYGLSDTHISLLRAHCTYCYKILTTWNINSKLLNLVWHWSHLCCILPVKQSYIHQ